MSIWQVQVHGIAIWNDTSRWHIPVKIDEIFKDLPNVFGTVESILIVGYHADGRDYNRALKQVMQICHKENLKLSKSKCHYRCTGVPFFGEIVSRNGVQLDPQKLQAVTNLPPILYQFYIALVISRYHKLPWKIFPIHYRGISHWEDFCSCAVVVHKIWIMSSLCTCQKTKFKDFC